MRALQVAWQRAVLLYCTTAAPIAKSSRVREKDQSTVLKRRIVVALASRTPQAQLGLPAFLVSYMPLAHADLAQPKSRLLRTTKGTADRATA